MNLLELQRRMTEDVCRPLTEDYAMQKRTEDGRSLTDLAESYIAPNALLTSFDRLEIYNRQYWFRVIGAVSEDFPTVEAVLGTDRFDELILAYLKSTPSTSWNLRDLSAGLPAFLQLQPPLAGRRHRLAVDVASLELAYIDAFDGGQLKALTTKDLQTIGPQSRLSLQPHLKLLALDYPVDDLVLKIRKERPESELVSNAARGRSSSARTKLAGARKTKVWLAVHRFDDSVYYRRLTRESFDLLKELRSGATIEESLTAAFRKTKMNAEEQAAIVQSCFALAAELGWLVSRD